VSLTNDQSDTQLVIEVKPIKEDPNKLTQGTQGYRGEKISFNFQDVDVRAILGIIADVSNLNILTSDSVSGKLTIRVKDGGHQGHHVVEARLNNHRLPI